MTGTAEKSPLSTDPTGMTMGMAGSQADSGVFTLGSQNYQYEQSYNGVVLTSQMNGGGYNNGINGGAYTNVMNAGGYSNNGLHASYDEGADRWGNAADPYGEMGMDPFV